MKAHDVIDSSTTKSSRLLVPVTALLLILIGIILAALLLGTPRLPLIELWEIMIGGGDRIARLVVLEVRLPRLLLGGLVGAALALAGVLLQDSLRNVLAGPELLGVSTGAALVVAIIVVFDISVAYELLPWLALAGGLISSGFLLLAAPRTGDPVRLVLIGAAVSALLNALIISIISVAEPYQINLLYLFLVGSLANHDWDAVKMVLPWTLVGLPLTMLFARPLNLLQLGDEIAEGLGLPVLRTRLLILLLSVELVAAVIAVCGPISFIALLSPHVARQLLGTSNAWLVLPIAALIGSILLCGADLVARELFAPAELPVGLWTTMLGAPVVLVLLRRQLGRRRA